MQEDFRFGSAVSISDNYAIICSRGNKDNRNHSGTAYVFRRDNNIWTQVGNLISDDASNFDMFAYSVSIDNKQVIIGSYGCFSNNLGSAYIFDVQTRSQQAKLVPNDSKPNDQFGISVSLSNNYAIVGAAYGGRISDGETFSKFGAAYIFENNNGEWSQQAKLLPDVEKEHSFFGYTVDISNDYAVVSARYDLGNKANSGAAYIYKRKNDNWFLEQKIFADDGYYNDAFGGSVSISGDYIIIGAPNKNDSSGSAYIFKRNNDTWYQQAKLCIDDNTEKMNFGVKVSISGNYAIVSSNNERYVKERGAIYIFVRDENEWVQQSKILASDGNQYDWFNHVSSSDSYFIVGAPGDDDYDENSGSAYIYPLSTINPIISGKVTDLRDIPFSNAEINFENLKTIESDNDGSFSTEVPYNWSGKATISYNNYIFNPQQISIDPISKNLNQNFNISVYTISGFVKDIFNNPISGTKIVFNNQGGTTLTNSQGYYSKEIFHNWSGNTYVEGKGYKYEPVVQTYNNVDQCHSNQNYTGSKLTISGYCSDIDQLPISNVEVTIYPLQRKIYSDEEGLYTFDIDYLWSGKITAQKIGYIFTPSFHEYSLLQTNIINQNFTGSSEIFTITGRIIDKNEAPVQNITIQIIENNTHSATHAEIQTDEVGQFSYQVSHGWSGNIEAVSSDYSFEPQMRQIISISVNMMDQNFIASLHTQNNTILNEWKQFNHHSFEFFGTLTCSIFKNNESIIQQGDYLAAFVDNEIRGIAEASSGPNGNLFFLQLWGDDKQQMQYKYYNSSDNSVYDLAYKTDYEPMISIGSVQEPYVIHLSDSNEHNFDFDVNHDNHINLIDVLLIIKHITGFH
ncbi:MAG: hypothetical protein OMM_03213 [Candidatus Magnetoglobus multicellularis str. Araruama]|uniref:Dockerin domain-containing protein n=1 Tax=Candidatus Magnetoglobus multicellularis str. Araruama TaxID=890399 RepID=A0A1V1P6G4_9BACT|nr:MAG: hypothetical protein OMM_03213 [Candidatus Magnetoglobus multicellularis str. Araruama]